MSDSPSRQTWATLLGVTAFSAMYYTTQVRKRDLHAKRLRVGTRQSNLAMWQANHVADRLRKEFPEAKVEVRGMKTLGDKDQMKPLNQFDTRGVFTKELDIALLTGAIDIAVHCLKDLPTSLPPGIVCAAILERGSVEDVLVLNAKHAGHSLGSLPSGSVVGTSALRRGAVLRRRYPHLVCKDIRGNVNTRLAKLDKGDYDAIILAKTGLERLNLDDRIAEVFGVEDYGYAVGQGALAILTRVPSLSEPHARMLEVLTHRPTLLATEAERHLLRTLAGGCSVPIVVRSRLTEEQPPRLTLFGAVLSVDGKTYITGERSTNATDVKAARALGARVAQELLVQGAGQVLISAQDRASS